MQIFDLNLSLILSHTIVYESGLNKPCECYCSNDSPATTAESTASMMQAYVKYLPDLMKVASGQLLPTEQAKLATAQVTDPGYLALQDALYKQYGPSLAATGNQINAQNALAQAESDLAVVSGPGRELAKQALETQKIADPEYYASRAAVSNKLNQLVNSYDPTGLSESERANVERAANQDQIRRGTFNTPSQTSTIENAMQFGDALDKKKSTLAQVLGIASGAVPNLKSNVDAYQVATGKPSAANLGDSKFIGANKNVGGETFGLSGNFLNSVNQLRQQASEQKFTEGSTFQDVQQGFGIIGNIIGGYKGAMR